MVSEKFNLYVHWCRPKVKDPLWCIKSRKSTISQRTCSEIKLLPRVGKEKTGALSLQMTECRIARWASSRIKLFL
jgi:hypothetical protein